MSWSSISYSNGTMPTDLGTSSSSSGSNGNIVGDDSIPTLIAQGNNNVNNTASNDRMSMESASSLSSSSHSLLPYSTMLASATNNITMTRYGDSNYPTASRSESETPKQPLPPRHRSVSISGIKSDFVPPPHSQTATASPNLMMSTPSFASRTLQPMENRMAGGGPPVSGQVNDSAAGAGAASGDGFGFLKSPTTLTFERMIEACTYDTM
jgi:hypothetical protein